MRQHRGSCSLRLTVLTWGLLLSAPLAAQSPTTATVSGTVTTSAGRPIAGALVTLTSLGSGRGEETTTDGSGAFRFGLVAPGSYELRAEALGYRPVVARTLTLSGGTRANVPLSIAPAPPPVLTVDTVAVAVAAASRVEAGGLRLGAREIDDLPYRFDELTALAGLSTSVDGSLGVEGLPGSMALTVVDGVPVYRAQHPVARAEQLSSGAFPRTALSGVSVVPNASDVEWTGSAGGHVALTTLTGTPGEGLVLEGAWSGAPLWSSGELDFSTPSLLSFQGAARATVPVTPGSSQLVVSGDVLQQETPLAARVSEAAAAGLTGLDPDLVTELSEPSVERYDRYSGLLRFDALGDESLFFVRGAAGYVKRETDGPGPVTLARDAAPAEESVEYSFAGGYVREVRPALGFEIRAGVSGGTRTFDPASEGRPAALLLDSGSSLGVLTAGEGESSRTDFVLSPVLRYGLGGGTLKVGMTARLTSHSMLHTRPADYLFSDGPALIAGQGYAGALDAPKASFSTRELGGFLQFESELSPALHATVGVRFDREWIPQDATLSTAWQQASGLRNDDYPGGTNQLGGGATLTWDPDAATRVFAAVSVQHGDIDSRVLGQVLSQDAGATHTAYAGPGLTWPGGSIPSGSTLPTLTLLGPDARAPRSIGASVGAVRQLAAGWSLHVDAAVRRTDFLMRRRNLNLPVMPQATDPDGRGVYGTLVQDGALVTATGSDARRFAGFGPVWALDPDGWSEYVGVTGGLEYAGTAADFFVAYTYSETTDNWVGAARGLADAELSPLLPAEQWEEGTSDFDVPHRVTAAGTARFGPAALSAVYHFRSGLPFTPRYRDGVDANGDGSLRNDVAYVDAATVDPLLSDWPCLDDQVGGFAVRNSCRGPSVHSLDLRLRVRVGRLAGRDASLVIDGFNVIESSDGVVDDALLLVDPAGSIGTSGGTVTIPFMVNPDFGSVLYPSTRGRMVRVGFRIG